jgi:hypothetical protein
MKDGTPITRGEFIRLLSERIEDFNQRFDELMAEQAAATDTHFIQTLRVNGQLVTREEPEGLEEYVQLRIRETRKLTVQALLETIFRTDGGSAR